MVTKEMIGKLIQTWFDEERGNRVTSNNVQGLMMKLGLLFDSAKDENKEVTPLNK